MKKLKLIALLSLVMITSIVMVGCGSRNGDKGENPVGYLSACGNFRLEIDVNKKNASIGDKIKVTSTLINLSGSAVEIEFIQRDIYTSATGENKIHLGILLDGHMPAVDTKVKSVKANIAKDSVLTRTVEETLNTAGEYHVWAEAIFFANGNTTPITLRIDSVRIQVK
ncbi:MAG: hypothetical protein FWE01_01265 [Firmicutes bacterium]|nr:hypothetical protein [Bacillota bacterium]